MSSQRPLATSRWSSFVAALLVCACSVLPTAPNSITNNVERQQEIVRLVDVARKNPSIKDELAKLVMSGPVLIIPDPNTATLALLFFDQPERAFIPLFSSRKLFDEEAYGTGFEGKAMAIDARRFASLLKGDEVVILNPGHRPAIEFKASELKAAAK